MHALHETWSSHDKVAVCLSVCLSIKHVDCDKTKESYAQILHHMKDHLAYPSFLRRRMVGATPSTRYFGVKLTLLERNRRF